MHEAWRIQDDQGIGKKQKHQRNEDELSPSTFQSPRHASFHARRQLAILTGIEPFRPPCLGRWPKDVRNRRCRLLRCGEMRLPSTVLRQMLFGPARVGYDMQILIVPSDQLPMAPSLSSVIIQERREMNGFLVAFPGAKRLISENSPR